jgi:hypothetical protein
MASIYDILDKNFEKVLKKVNKVFNPDDYLEVNYSFSTKDDEYYVDILNKKGKFLMRATYSVIGIFDTDTNIWVWAWGSAFNNKKLVKDSEVIKEFAIDVQKNKYKADESDAIYYYANNSLFMTKQSAVPLFIKMFLYKSDSLWFLPVRYGVDEIDGGDSGLMEMEHKLVEYIALKKVVQIS